VEIAWVVHQVRECLTLPFDLFTTIVAHVVAGKGRGQEELVAQQQQALLHWAKRDMKAEVLA
jgi:hypothetical protein